MIRIAICGDEQNTRYYLASLIRAQNAPCETEVFEFASTTDFLAQGQEFDLLFLDIEMDSSISVENRASENSFWERRVESQNLYQEQSRMAALEGIINNSVSLCFTVSLDDIEMLLR